MTRLDSPLQEYPLLAIVRRLQPQEAATSAAYTSGIGFIYTPTGVLP